MLVIEQSCPDEQGVVIESKGLIICRCLGIFTRSKTKEESNTHHIGNHSAFWRWIGSVGEKENVDYQCDGNGLDTNRRGVILFK